MTSQKNNRLARTFARLKAENKAAFIAYIMGGDPDRAASEALLGALPLAGADIVELGIPFTDPMADGPVIEAAGIRARKAGATLKTVLDMARIFRGQHPDTPLILMGYCNPIHHMGYAVFAKAAFEAGVDGAIIVDLPPEEDAELRTAFSRYDLALIRLATPTTDAARLPKVVSGSRGFVYYVSMTGVTGTALSAAQSKAGKNQAGTIKDQVARVRAAGKLPVVVGFGVKTPESARAIARHADGVVVGSAIIKALHENGPDAALKLTSQLSTATHEAKK